MGWCHEFGPQIDETCEHPMTAHADRCECSVCGTACTGRFAGCGVVWARGPRDVAVNAPPVAQYAKAANDPLVKQPEGDRWRLPLENVAAAVAPTFDEPAPIAEPLTATSEPEPQPQPEPEPERDDRPAFESPDVTARYAVAQLEELNNRVANLTEDTTARAETALARVYGELHRLASQREIDLTEQAAGIFGAVQAGSEALTTFSQTVAEVTDDLRRILNDALKAIGGTDGLAAWVAAAATDVQETRQEFAASLGKIERDITLLRRRSNADAKAKTIKLDDDQVVFIIDAVTDSVLAALESSGRKRR